MRSWTVFLAIALVGSIVPVAAAQEDPLPLPQQRKSMSLTDAVKDVVQRSDVMTGGDGDDFETGAGMDSTDVTSGLLDEVLLTPDPYYYESLGRRDPFVSLVMEEEDDSNLSESSIHVVGILWGERDKFALIETGDGASAILRKGDRFRNAEVTDIRKDGITLYMRQYGIGRALVLPLTEGKGSKNGNRER